MRKTKIQRPMCFFHQLARKWLHCTADLSRPSLDGYLCICFLYLKGREMSEIESSRPMVHSLNIHNSQGWTSPKLSLLNDGRDPIIQAIICYFPGCTLTGRQNSGMGCKCPRQHYYFFKVYLFYLKESHAHTNTQIELFYLLIYSPNNC